MKRFWAVRKIAARIAASDSQELIQLLKAQALFVLPETVPAISRDPKDDVFLACALAADADVLITGDQDLLVLKLHGRTRILTAAEFLEVLEPAESQVTATAKEHHGNE